jgi:hypothetical protein
MTFEEVHPGPCKDYMYHHTIKKFLEDILLDPLVSDKKKHMDYRGSSVNHTEIIRADHPSKNMVRLWDNPLFRSPAS